MKKYFLSLWVLCAVFLCRFDRTEAQSLPLIPYPSKLVLGQGSFVLSPKTQLVVRDKGLFYKEVSFFQRMMVQTFGQALGSQEGTNVFEIVSSADIVGEEAYRLDIGSSKILLEAKSPAGVFYGLQTIRQLLPAEMESGKKIFPSVGLPVLHIEDRPAFAWRGMELDVSRHFFGMEYLKKCIDRLAFYKMNKFHLHLTDDQGWRIEIKKYPELTSKGGWRSFNNQDSACMGRAGSDPNFEIDSRYMIDKGGKTLYGGYYTQDQIRDLVRYAAERHVEIIPEIDMPGHMMAAIGAFPYLTDAGKAGWGKQFSIPLCPAKDSVYTFVENVLSEVADLFPSKYIHVGSDEVEKTSWEHSSLCRQLMEKEGMKDVKQLQSYFLRRVQKFIEQKGKKVIVWDDALEGGIDSTAAVMYWRGWFPKAPLEAVENGNPLIMSPNNPLYFDYQPNSSSVFNVYHTDIVGKDIPAGKIPLIMGAQANLWAEMVPSEKRADFMLFPRLTALAEKLWTNKDLYDSYCNRLLEHYSRLEALGVNYRLPDIDGVVMECVYPDKAYLYLKNPVGSMKIHYTTDGSAPQLSSPVLNKPVLVDQPARFRLALFTEGGTRGDIYDVNYRHMAYIKPISLAEKKLERGLNAAFYDKEMSKTTEIAGLPSENFTTKNFEVPSQVKAPSFGMRFTGYVDFPETGIYGFFLNCDDSGMLYIDGKLIVDNQGPHSPVEKSGQVAVKKGLHSITLDFVEGGGGYTLKMRYSLNGGSVKDVPEEWLYHKN